MIYWVLDSCIIASSNDDGCDEYWDCVSLLIKVGNEDGICLDAEGGIEAEYQKHLNSRLTQTWWDKMIHSQGKVHTCSSRLFRRHKEALDKMKFHDDDIKFVGTAFNSPDHKLVSHDSNYNVNIINYLTTKCSIEVVHPCNCYNPKL